MKLLRAAFVAAVSLPVPAQAFWILQDSTDGVRRLPAPAAVPHALIFPGDPGFVEMATMELALPDGVVQFVQAHARRRVDGASWHGHAGGQPEGQVHLTLHKGMLAGLVSLQEATYEVVPVDVGHSRLQRVDHAMYPPCSGGLHAGEDLEASPAQAVTGSDAAFRDRQDDIDVLIVYTAAAREGAGGTAQIEATAQAAVDNANASFTNSLMLPRFNLVGAYEVEYEETGSGSPALGWLRDSKAITALRDKVYADMVSLFIETDPNGCGVGYVLNSLNPAFERSAVQVTVRSCAVGNLTYAHEHGHNMGMLHNPESAGSSNLAPDAYGHWDNSGPTTTERFRTVLSYACPSGPSCSRRMYFSNPDVSYMGRPTGIPDERNNARVGNYTSQLIANFRIKTIMRHGFD